MSDHLKGLLLTTLGVLLVVPDALFVRLIQADPLVTAFWRGITAGGFILVAVLAVQGLEGFRAVFRTGWIGVLYIALIGSTAPAFVLAVENTSVANAVFIFASMPIATAILGRVFLGEMISLRMVLTMVAVLTGLGIIAYGSGTTEIGSWKGDIWAVYVTIAFAAALTAVRKVKEVSMIPAIPIGYIGSALVVGLFITPVPDAMAFVPGTWRLYRCRVLFVGTWPPLYQRDRGFIGRAARISSGAAFGLGDYWRKPGSVGVDGGRFGDRRAVDFEPLCFDQSRKPPNLRPGLRKTRLNSP